MNYRTCTKCGEEKPATLEFFYKQKAGKYGLRANCKPCAARPKKPKRQNERIPEGFLIKSRAYGTHKVLINEEDWSRVKGYYWGPHSRKKDGTCYIATTIPHPEGGTRSCGRLRETRLSLHRFLMNCPKGMEVDHINHNKLDNRKENLRICTRSENGKNLRKRVGHGSSPYKGVMYSKKSKDMKNERSKPWFAHIISDGVHYHLGMFATKEEAAMVYDEACRKHHGEYGVLNFPDGVSEDTMTIIEEGRANVPKQTSEYHGVCRETARRREGKMKNKRPNLPYKISMNVEGEILHWGSFPSAEEAAWERDKIVNERGLDKPLNFPDGLTDEIRSTIETKRQEYQTRLEKFLDKRFIYEIPKYKEVESPTGKPYYVMFWDPKAKKHKRFGSYWTYEEAKLARDEYLKILEDK